MNTHQLQQSPSLSRRVSAAESSAAENSAAEHGLNGSALVGRAAASRALEPPDSQNAHRSGGSRRQREARES